MERLLAAVAAGHLARLQELDLFRRISTVN